MAQPKTAVPYHPRHPCQPDHKANEATRAPDLNRAAHDRIQTRLCRTAAANGTAGALTFLAVL